MVSACAGRCLAAATLPHRATAAPTIFAALNLGLRCRHANVHSQPRTNLVGLRRSKSPKVRLHASASASASSSAAAEPPSTKPAHLVWKVAAALLAIWQHGMNRLADLILWKGGQEDATVEDKNAQIRQTVRNMRCLCAVAPFATSDIGTGAVITQAFHSFLGWYLLALFTRVLLSWFPVFDWDRQPWLAVRQVTDPYLNMFRGLLPPLMGSVDFTPLFGFYLLQSIQGLFETGDPDWPDGEMLEDDTLEYRPVFTKIMCNPDPTKEIP